MTQINVTIIPYNRDNYAYLLEASDGTTAIIDAGDDQRIDHVLQQGSQKLDYILSTHHHFDHTDGNVALKKKYDAKIIAPKNERPYFIDMDIAADESYTLPFGEDIITVIDTPGHTVGHVCYYMPKNGFLFTGDTMFSMGCGGLFEGTPKQMWNSLSKLKKLPDDTLVFAGHEYTINGARFCSSVEPNNTAIKKRTQEVLSLLSKKQPTLPVPLGTEKATNAFLRADEPALQKAIGMEGAAPLDVFTVIREGKSRG